MLAFQEILLSYLMNDPIWFDYNCTVTLNSYCTNTKSSLKVLCLLESNNWQIHLSFWGVLFPKLFEFGNFEGNYPKVLDIFLFSEILLVKDFKDIFHILRVQISVFSSTFYIWSNWLYVFHGDIILKVFFLSLACCKQFYLHLFPMHPLSTLWKHQMSSKSSNILTIFTSLMTCVTRQSISTYLYFTVAYTTTSSSCI